MVASYGAVCSHPDYLPLPIRYEILTVVSGLSVNQGVAGSVDSCFVHCLAHCCLLLLTACLLAGHTLEDSFLLSRCEVLRVIAVCRFLTRLKVGIGASCVPRPHVEASIAWLECTLVF
jgi:hypothetical protein